MAFSPFSCGFWIAKGFFGRPWGAEALAQERRLALAHLQRQERDMNLEVGRSVREAERQAQEEETTLGSVGVRWEFHPFSWIFSSILRIFDGFRSISHHFPLVFGRFLDGIQLLTRLERGAEAARWLAAPALGAGRTGGPPARGQRTINHAYHDGK